MNTKTTKFLAVLAVLAMAFASVAIITTSDSSDATTYTVVDGMKITDVDGLDISVTGDTATFVGTVAMDSSTSSATETMPIHVKKIALNVSGLGYTKMKVTDTAYQGASTKADYKEFTTLTSDIEIPMPKDGSSVTVELYSGSPTYVLEKTIILDFADAYTQVTPGTADEKSIGYTPSSISYWSYASSGNTLTLHNYGGNEVFKFSTAAVIILEGNNYLGMVIADGLSMTKNMGGSLVNAVISCDGKLTIKTKSATDTALLSIDLQVGDDVTATGGNSYAAIYATGEIDASAFYGKIEIDVDGEIDTDSQAAQGIYSSSITAGVTIGAAGNYVDVDINVTGNGRAIGSLFDLKLYMTGKVVGGNVGIGMQRGGSSGNSNIIEGKALTIQGSEAAYKSYTEGNTFQGEDIKLGLLDAALYNEGKNPKYALSVQQKGTATGYNVTVAAGCTVETDGMAVYRHDNYTQTANGTITANGVLKINGGYVQNPDSKLLPKIAGFNWQAEVALANENIYQNAFPSGVTAGIILQNSCETFGPMQIAKSDGTIVSKVISDASKLTTDELKMISATTVYAYLTGNETLSANVEVPSWMTLVLNASTVDVNKMFTAGGQSVKFTSFDGTMTMNKSGITLTDVTGMAITAAKGSITLDGTFTGSSTITEDTNALDITLADGLNIRAKDLTISAAKSAVTIPVDAEVIITVASSITAKTVDIKGTLTAGADIATTIDGAITVSGKVVGYTAYTNPFITIATSSSLDVTGVVGYGNSVLIGNATNKILAQNLTGFKLVASSDETPTYTISGTVAQYGELTATGTMTGTFAASDITVGKNVTLTAGTFNIDGKLDVQGILVGGEKLKVGVNNDSTVTVSGAIRGIIYMSTTKLTMKIGDSSTVADVTGYKIVNDLSLGTVTMSEKLSLTGTIKKVTSTVTDAVNVTYGTLTVKDLAMDKYVQMSLVVGTKLKGTLVGPSGEAATFSASAAEASTITAGSLVVSGKISNTPATTPCMTVTAGTVTIVANNAATAYGDIVVKNSAALDIEPASKGKVLETAKIDLQDTASLEGADNIDTNGDVSVKAAAGTTTDAFNAKIKYVDGAYVYFTPTGSSTKYLLKMQTFDDEQYMSGVKLYSYTGTGQSPLTEETIVTYSAKVSAPQTGTVYTGSAIKKTVPDAVGIVDDAVAVTVKDGCVISAPAEVVPAEATIVLNVDAADVTWDGVSKFDSDIWTKSADFKTLTGTFKVSDKTSTFGDLPVPKVTKTNYVFDEWVTLGDTPVAYDKTKTIYEYTNSLADKVEFKYTLSSIYDTTYTVTFDSNGGSAVASQTVKYATKADEPDAPVKADYKFVAWYTEAELINKYNFRTAVTEDITLYAKWELDETVYASAVDIAVSKISGGVKVTVAGEEDLAVPAGTVTVKYAYWITIESTKILQWKSVDKTMTAGPIVNSIEVTGLGSAVFVEVSYASADGEVTGSTPRIVY